MFGETMIAQSKPSGGSRAVAAEAAMLLGPSLHVVSWQDICSASGPRRGQAAQLPCDRLVASALHGWWGSSPHSPLDPTLLLLCGGRSTVPLGVRLGLAEFGGVLKEPPAPGQRMTLLSFSPFSSCNSEPHVFLRPRGALDSCPSITRPLGTFQE